MSSRRTYRSSETWLAYGFMLPAAILVAVLMYWPMIDTFSESLYTTSFINPKPIFVGLATYARDLRGPGLLAGAAQLGCLDRRRRAAAERLAAS